MKVTLVSTYDARGGAAMATYRLYRALAQTSISAHHLVKTPSGKEGEPGTEVIEDTPLKRYTGLGLFALEKLHFLFYEKSSAFRFGFSSAYFGRDITKHPLVKQSDILHLHWINQGFLTLKGLEKLAQTGKPIVWTLRDMWAFTGGCHYSGDCTNYQETCGYCPYLRKPGPNDLSHKIWKKKKGIFEQMNLQVVGLSNWIANCARQSSLLHDKPITTIPNVVDSDTYRPYEMKSVRKELGLPQDKWLIAFAAEVPSHYRKGFHYLKDALELLAQNYPSSTSEIELLVIGNVKQDVFNDFPFPVRKAGFLSDKTEMAKHYSAANLFVLPSIDENLPNTVLESLSCGTPSVGFNVGGVGDLIEHRKNGYLAEAFSSEDIAEGIHWCMASEERYRELSENARQNVLNKFSPDVITSQYLQLYEDLCR